MVRSNFLMNATAVSKNDTKSVTGNSTSAISYEWEYYYDYLDPVIVDESKLKYNKCKFLNVTFLKLCSYSNVTQKILSFSDSIVIILWISLAAFVGFLFLSLNLMSMRGKLPK